MHTPSLSLPSVLGNDQKWLRKSIFNTRDFPQSNMINHEQFHTPHKISISSTASGAILKIQIPLFGFFEKTVFGETATNCTGESNGVQLVGWVNVIEIKKVRVGHVVNVILNFFQVVYFGEQQYVLVEQIGLRKGVLVLMWWSLKPVSSMIWRLFALLAIYILVII